MTLVLGGINNASTDSDKKNNEQYFIGVNENGEVFIAHSGTYSIGKYSPRKNNHKYLAKVQVAPGVWRYFYTQEEIDSYNKRKKDSLFKSNKKVEYSKDAVSDMKRRMTKMQNERKMAEKGIKEIEHELRWSDDDEEEKMLRKMLNERKNTYNNIVRNIQQEQSLYKTMLENQEK